jgi:hypothetical protein
MRTTPLLLALVLGPGLALADCGRISTFDVAPRNQQLYRAVLIAIDGRKPANVEGHSFRLPAGRHVLTVAEAIDPHRFNRVEQVQRDRRSRERYKTIEVDVAVDTTYFLAARLDLDRRGEIRSGAYWDPVIWKQATEACR